MKAVKLSDEVSIPRAAAFQLVNRHEGHETDEGRENDEVSSFKRP